MPESYVRPVTGAREPRPEWIATWRFRLAALALLALVTLGVIWAWNQFVVGTNRQDPSFESAPAATAPR